MSTISGQDSAIISTIVRGYGNRPVRLKASLLPGGMVEVFRDDPGSAMGWPASEIYQDDGSVFERIETAWKAGNKKSALGRVGERKADRFT